MAATPPEDCLLHLEHHALGPECEWHRDAYLDWVSNHRGMDPYELYVSAYERALVESLCSRRDRS